MVGSMSKPVIFFSHSSKDKSSLIRLKDSFVQKTGGSIEVFLSSDGQSIRLGRNWVYKIQEALEHAKILLAFLTPSALQSNWMFFESGFCYAKNIRIVPVGFKGVDLITLSPPLSLFQGFNIKSEDGLNNIIALANEVFDFKHILSFTREEYANILGFDYNSLDNALGRNTTYINELYIYLSEKDELKSTSQFSLSIISDLLKQNKIEYQHGKQEINFHGVSVTTTGDVPDNVLRIIFDPGNLSYSLPIVENITKSIRTDGINGVKLGIELGNDVYVLVDMHKITSRLFNTNIRLGNSNGFCKDEIDFYFIHRIKTMRQIRNAQLVIHLHSDSIKIKEIAELIDLLFDRGILYVEKS